MYGIFAGPHQHGESPLPIFRLKPSPFPVHLPIPDKHFEPNYPRLQKVFPDDELVKSGRMLDDTAFGFVEPSQNIGGKLKNGYIEVRDPNGP